MHPCLNKYLRAKEHRIDAARHQEWRNDSLIQCEQPLATNRALEALPGGCVACLSATHPHLYVCVRA